MNLLSKGYPKLHAVELKIRGYFFKRKLRKIAVFIKKHNLYPVHMDRDLLDIWMRY